MTALLDAIRGQVDAGHQAEIAAATSQMLAEWSRNAMAADLEGNLIADFADYARQGGQLPRNRAERRRLTRLLVAHHRRLVRLGVR